MGCYQTCHKALVGSVACRLCRPPAGTVECWPSLILPAEMHSGCRPSACRPTQICALCAEPPCWQAQWCPAPFENLSPSSPLAAVLLRMPPLKLYLLWVLAPLTKPTMLHCTPVREQPCPVCALCAHQRPQPTLNWFCCPWAAAICLGACMHAPKALGVAAGGRCACQDAPQRFRQRLPAGGSAACPCSLCSRTAAQVGP